MMSPAVLDALPLAAASIRLRQTRAAASVRAWRAKARPDQLPPESDWSTWYVRGGRGGGKTWTGANNLAELALTTIGEWAVVAPTFGDARDTCVEGPSGLLAAFGTNRAEVDRGHSQHVKAWNRSLGELRLRNGSVIWADGADDGALRIQGKNLRGAWCDEVGLWKRWQVAWDESIGFAVRLAPALIVATGTPKRGHPLVKRLMDDAAIPKKLLRTADNEANLDPATLARWKARWEGTTLGRQELLGELIEDADGALWKRSMIVHERPQMFARDGAIVPAMRRIVVAVDPAVTHDADSDETGIVVSGLGADGLGWVLEDVSMRGSPVEWARAAVAAYHRHKADRIVAEANQGGEMVELTIRTVDPNVPVTLVHATQGKRTRAEPVSALYEQSRVRHAEPMPELEDQMCNWDPVLDDKSPDRVDALVWGLTDLILKQISWGSAVA